MVDLDLSDDDHGVILAGRLEVADTAGVRFVLCDEDYLLRELVESVVTKLGHEVVGAADATATASKLVETARPDVVILDLSLGYNTDFDVIATAGEVGATVIVFSRTADEATLQRYPVRPLVVPKPELTTLEETIRMVAAVHERGPGEDRRRRPPRAAAGPQPTGVGDAQAFYEALNNADADDTLVAIEVMADGETLADAELIGTRVSTLVRATDRVLAIPSSVKVFLPGGALDGVRSFIARLRREIPLPPEVRVRSIVIAAGESAVDAFDRLKHHGDDHPA